jgi:hypothetical protein
MRVEAKRRKRQNINYPEWWAKTAGEKTHKVNQLLISSHFFSSSSIGDRIQYIPASSNRE